MAIVFPDEGERFVLNLLLRATIPADFPFILGLFANDVIIAPGTVLNDIVEVAYSGYLPVPLERSGWSPPVTVGPYAQSVYGTEFINFLPDSGEVDVFGWYLRDIDSNVLICGQNFAGPVTIDPTHPVLILPVMRVRSEV